MGRIGGRGALPAAMALAVALGCGLALARGGIWIGKHEGDTLHLADIVLRMALHGQRPHLDFMTPLGVLCVAPIALFVRLGAPLGAAFVLAQGLVALLLLAPAAHAAASRFPPRTALLYGVYVMVLATALVHGETNTAISVSMHYNRWAWAVAYVIVPLALLPPRGPARPLREGAIIGAGVGVLALLKVTYVVGLAPGLAVLLVLRREGRALVAALAAGAAVAAVATALLGAAFWPAYLGDLLSVARSETRAAPGAAFGDVLGAPAFLAASAALLAGVVLLRRSGRAVEGLGLFLLAPGFVYITWQNFGNDPQWLVCLGASLLALAPGPGAGPGTGPEPAGAGRGLALAGAIALALGAGSAVNLATSPLRHAAFAPDDPVPLLPNVPQARDLFGAKGRLYHVVRTTEAGADDPLAARAWADPEARPTVVNGETFPDCEMQAGLNAWFETVAAALEAGGARGQAILGADLFGAYWLFGDLAPVRGGAPWFYAGASGIAAADAVLVPLCASGRAQRRAILEGIAAAGYGLAEIRRTALFVLYRPVPPAQDRSASASR